MAGIAVVVHVLVMVVIPAVLMVNLTVAMANVSMDHGHVTVMVTVLMVPMKLIAANLMIHVLKTIVKTAHIGMAIVVTIVVIV